MSCMNNNNLKEKTWDELCLMAFKNLSERKGVVQAAIDELEEIWHMFDFSEVECYIESMAKKIQIPKWNKYPEISPKDLEIYAEFYCVLCGDDLILNAVWNNGEFLTFSNIFNKWESNKEVEFWIPITYPTPY